MIESHSDRNGWCVCAVPSKLTCRSSEKVVDDLTHRYYSTHAREVAERYDTAEAPMARVLRRAFTEGMRVLDVGAGSGRDVDLLLRMGCEAYGVEPSEELRAVAIEHHPALTGRLQQGALPRLGQPFGAGFDGVLCSAVLMHLQRADILEAAIAVRSILTENGRLLLSVPVERPDLGTDSRDKDGRLFTPLPPDYLQLLFERVGFRLLDRWQSQDSLGRPGYSWCYLLLQAHHLSGSRPLDQIEGILNRDRKTATYKLALIRALGEIAMTEFEQAKWASDGVVGIPVSAVSEKWLGYYWPIFESADFIPQIRGESEVCRKPVAFRSSLRQLIDRYKHRGGLTGFVLDHRGGRLPDDARSVLAAVQAQIRNTIVVGPVTYAGGALESGPIFQFDSRSGEIRMDAALWREFSLVGHWIQDAVILRWAELTSEISRKEIRPSEVIDLLLTVPIPERDVSDAKRAYSQALVSECTWSSFPLRKSFDIDHIIPFALWHNNDLWNLVPAVPSVNLAKSDKLPTRGLLMARRDRIVGCWEVLRAAYRARFDYEVCRVAGVNTLPSDWQSLAFQYVSDAVEFTAVQRGCRRWQPEALKY
jgi:SAM-dependent methyltransferase